jgi:hypothetical protein
MNIIELDLIRNFLRKKILTDVDGGLRRAVQSLMESYDAVQTDRHLLDDANIRLNEDLKRAVQYLREGKAKFAAGTTNSFVDDFLEKYKEL